MSEHLENAPRLPSGDGRPLAGASGLMVESALVRARLFAIACALARAAAREDAAEEERAVREQSRRSASVDVAEL
jgi:hypothetical protein